MQKRQESRCATSWRKFTSSAQAEKDHLLVVSLYSSDWFYAAAAGDIDLCAAWLMNFFITLAHITFLRTALSFTVRPWANIPSSAFILKTRRMAASDWLTL